MTTTSPISALRSAMLIIIQLIEIPLVAIVAVLAIFTERLEPTYLTTALALLLLPNLLRLLVAGRITEPTLLLWPLLLLGALGGASVYVTPTWHYTWPELVRLLAGVALCLAVINWVNPIGGRTMSDGARVPERLIVGTLVFLLVCAGLTAVGLLVLGPTNKFLPPLPWAESEQLRQLTTSGTFNPNRVAGVAVLAAPLTLILLLGRLRPLRSSPMRWLGWFATKGLSLGLTLLFGAALLLTQSRGALLAFGTAILLVLLFLGRRGWIILALLIVLGTGALVDLRGGELSQLLVVRDDNSAGVANRNLFLEDRNLRGRLVLWQRALHGIADAPLTGMGLGAFAAISQEPYPALPAFVPDPDMSHVHNLILQMGVDLGLPGLLLFVTLLVMVALALGQMVRLARADSPLRTWSLALLGSFIAYFVYNLFDALTLGARPALAAWLLFGLWIGGAEWLQAQASAQARRLASHQRSNARPAVAPRREVTAYKAEEKEEEEEEEYEDEYEEDEEDDDERALERERWEARAWATTAGTET